MEIAKERHKGNKGGGEGNNRRSDFWKKIKVANYLIHNKIRGT